MTQKNAIVAIFSNFFGIINAAISVVPQVLTWVNPLGASIKAKKAYETGPWPSKGQAESFQLFRVLSLSFSVILVKSWKIVALMGVTRPFKTLS
jgi:hypothetical protein